jgi:hypothetical protein
MTLKVFYELYLARTLDLRGKREKLTVIYRGRCG